jgi:ribokinase
MSNFDVIVCGSLHLDIVVQAPALPRIDETAVGSGWKKLCGGKGGNQAVQAARAGARTAMIGRIGDDDFGRTLLTNLESAKVDISALTTDPVNGSGMSVAILQDNGDYGAVIVSGANTRIDPANVQAQWTALGGAKVLVLQNEIPHAANVAAANAARSAGASTIFNAAPARDMGSELLDLVDVLIVNRIEAEAMCGRKVDTRASAGLAMPALISRANSVVITLGGEGLVVGTSTGQIVEIDPIRVEVTPTHGAGDGATLLDACHAANQSAAAFVSRTT